MSNITKTITQLKKVYKEYQEEDKPLAEEELKGYMDNTSVVMFIPKTERMKQAFKSTFEGEERKQPELTGETKTSKYSVEYLTFLLELLKQSEEESVKLTVGNDYPLIAETKTFKLILAPRVSGNDWED